MELIQAGNNVLFVWHGQQVQDLEQQLNEIKKIASVKVENVEILSQASHAKSSFDVIFINVTSNDTLSDDVLKTLLLLTKPKGKIVFSSNINADDDFKSRLLLTGFVNVTFNGSMNVAEKPNYEVGSSVKLNFAKKQPAPEAQKIWKLDVDDDDEMIDADELLDEEDKKKPDDSSLRVCSTTGKRKACKDCSCGLAEELDAESKGVQVADNNPKSSCGSCYLGDAFRCSTCPYLGLPPFKPGEKIEITDIMKNDV